MDLLFPKLCLSCKRNGQYLCPICMAKVGYAKTVCPSCNRFNFYGKPHDNCRTEISLNGLAPLWNYEGVLRESIIKLKFNFVREIAKELGELSSIEVQKFKFSSDSIIVPIPLHIYRKNWRGFNQTEEVARVLSERLKWRINTSLLLRNTHTKPQVKTNVRSRLENVSNIFVVNKNVVKSIPFNTPLLLFDDVWTTGATIKEACRVLRLAGYTNVSGLVIAKRR